MQLSDLAVGLLKYDMDCQLTGTVFQNDLITRGSGRWSLILHLLTLHCHGNGLS